MKAAQERKELYRLVEEHNFEGLKNYLSNRKSEAKLDPELIKAAFREFLASDIRNMTNSQNIIVILHDHVYDHMTTYKNSKDHKLALELFEMHDRAKGHKGARTGSKVSQEIAEDYSSKMAVFEEKLSQYNKIDNDKKRVEFKREIILIANAEAKRRIGTVDLVQLEEVGRKDYFSFVTGYSENDLDSMLNEIIEGLPDKFFDQAWKGMLDAQALIVEQILGTALNLNKGDDFLNFIYKLIGNLITTIKDAAIAVSNPTKVISIKVETLGLIGLAFKLMHIKDPGQESSEMKNFAANSVSYLDSLLNEGKLLKQEIEDLSTQELKHKLDILKRFVAVANFINTKLLLSPNSKVLQSINSFSYKHFSAEELVKYQESIELTLIKKLNGPEGDVVLPNGITQRQVFAMQLFTEVAEKKRKLPDEQMKFVHTFIKSAIANVSLKNLKSCPNVPKNTVEILSIFSDKTEDLQKFLSAYKKLKRNYDKILNHEASDDQDKVELGEYAILMQYAYSPTAALR